MGSDAESKLAAIGGGVEVVQIPVHVADTNVQDGARQILAVLRPDWSSENIQFKLFTDGITNKLVGCYHRAATSASPSARTNGQQQRPAADTDDSNNSSHSSSSSAGSGASLPAAAADVVLIRVYGNNTELLIDRQAETRNIKMLQRHGFAPNLYAVFQNGLAYEYVPGCTLTPQSVRSPSVWPLVARHMAKMHRLAVRGTAAAAATTTGLGGGEPAEPMLAAKMRSFLDLVPERFADEAKESRLRSLGLPTVQRLRADFDALYARLRRLASPVVFAHNDLLLGNVIYEESASRVAFIDYEYAAHNYQAFDIGNHFTEFAGIDSIDYSLYPDEQFQLQWLRVYLAAYKAELGDADVDEREVRRMYGEVNAFALASHYFWAVWALIQAEHSTIDFDFVEFAMMRYNEYLARKDEFLALIE